MSQPRFPLSMPVVHGELKNCAWILTKWKEVFDKIAAGAPVVMTDEDFREMLNEIVMVSRRCETLATLLGPDNF